MRLFQPSLIQFFFEKAEAFYKERALSPESLLRELTASLTQDQFFVMKIWENDSEEKKEESTALKIRVFLEEWIEAIQKNDLKKPEESIALLSVFFSYFPSFFKILSEKQKKFFARTDFQQFGFKIFNVKDLLDQCARATQEAECVGALETLNDLFLAGNAVGYVSKILFLLIDRLERRAHFENELKCVISFLGQLGFSIVSNHVECRVVEGLLRYPAYYPHALETLFPAFSDEIKISVIQKLKEKLLDPNVSVKMASARTLFALLDQCPKLCEAAIDALLKLAKDQDREVRKTIIEGFVTLNIPSPRLKLSVAKVILNAMCDVHWRVRLYACKAIGRYKAFIQAQGLERKLMDYAVKQLACRDPEVRNAYIQLLSSFQQSKEFMYLSALLSSKIKSGNVIESSSAKKVYIALYGIFNHLPILSLADKKIENVIQQPNEEFKIEEWAKKLTDTISNKEDLMSQLVVWAKSNNENLKQAIAKLIDLLNAKVLFSRFVIESVIELSRELVKAKEEEGIIQALFSIASIRVFSMPALEALKKIYALKIARDGLFESISEVYGFLVSKYKFSTIEHEKNVLMRLLSHLHLLSVRQGAVQSFLVEKDILPQVLVTSIMSFQA